MKSHFDNPDDGGPPGDELDTHPVSAVDVDGVARRSSIEPPETWISLEYDNRMGEMRPGNVELTHRQYGINSRPAHQVPGAGASGEPHLDHSAGLEGARAASGAADDGSALRSDERALREFEARYRLIAAAINDVMIETDLAFTCRYASPSAETVLGYRPADLIGRHPADLVHPDDREAFMRIGNEVRTGLSEHGLITLRCRHTNGHWVWLETSLRPVPDAETGAAAGILATSRDITPLKLAENRLRFSEAQHRALIAAFPHLLALASTEPGASPSQNQHFERYFGSATPSSTAQVAQVHPEGVALYQNLWASAYPRQGRLEGMSERDTLTGLHNRRFIERWLVEAVDRARHEPEHHAVLVCDIDRFRAVNDALGHRVGDLVLCAAAARIRAAIGAQDVVARLGGDEFAVLLGGVDGRAGTTRACERIIAALGDPLDAGSMSVTISISIGAAVLTADGASAEEVFKRADVALYEAKAGGRNTCRLFEAETHARATSRSLLALGLPLALRRGEISLVYQPIIDVETGTASSCEALMRWHHPERGPVSPAEFIPVAEETGAIIALGAWAMAEACREAAAWPGDVGVTVNVSSMQMAQGIERTVREALELSRLSPDRLVLEITESALIRDPEQAKQTLLQLKMLGVRIALNDFGTGYSSLSYLRLFPFDKLKIDTSFVRDIADPDTAAIVRAVVSIGERLGMSIVAEGVETEEQLLLVKHEGCRHVQGFLFSRPLPACETRAYLAAQLP